MELKGAKDPRNRELVLMRIEIDDDHFNLSAVLLVWTQLLYFDSSFTMRYMYPVCSVSLCKCRHSLSSHLISHLGAIDT